MQLDKLRAYYHSLTAIEQNLQNIPSDQYNVDGCAINVLNQEIVHLNSDFPGTFPAFNKKDFFSHGHGEDEYFNRLGIQTYLSTVIGRLKTVISDSKNTPVTEVRDFSFIRETQLREIIERDYAEIQRSYIAKCWKSVIILSGGLIEAILIELLKRHELSARQSLKSPQKTNIMDWDLSALINVSVDLKLVSGGIEKLSHSVREYRNLVHPGNEIKNQLVFDQEEARIALEVLHIVQRDLCP